MQSNIANFTKQAGHHDIDSDAGGEAMPLTNEDLVELDHLMTEDYKTNKKNNTIGTQILFQNFIYFKTPFTKAGNLVSLLLEGRVLQV